MMGKAKIKFAVLAGKLDLSLEGGFLFRYTLYAGKSEKRRSVGYGNSLDSVVMRALWLLKRNIEHIKAPTDSEIEEGYFVEILEHIQLVDFLIPYLYLTKDKGRYEID